MTVAIVPTALPAPVQGDTVDARDGHKFLVGLARAEQKHDYRALLAGCDQQIAARPEDREAYRRRALARWGARQYDGALTDFGRAIDLAHRQKAPPRAVAILTYGRALIRREQHDTHSEAAELDRAVRSDRSFTDPLNDLAWICATNPDASLRDGQRAVALARQACKTVPDSAKYLDTLAAAYAEAGEARQAVSTEKAAMKFASSSTRSTGEYEGFLADARNRVSLYAAGERYRDSSAVPTASKAR